MHRQFVREMPEKVDKDETWQWLSKSDLKIETEALAFSAEEQTIRKSYLKHHTNKTSETTQCKLCGKKVCNP